MNPTRRRKTKSGNKQLEDELDERKEMSEAIINNREHSNSVGVNTEQNPVLLVDQPNKWRNMWVRLIWTLIMMGGYVAIILAGHVWVIALICVIQTIVYREVISICIVPSQERKLPWLRALHWYFLLSTNYFLYGESLIHYFKPVVFVDAFLMPLATHHRFISFLLYCVGLVNFVLNLKKGFYRFQFSHFCWTHMALLLIVVQSHCIINNIFEGLVWFVLPVSLVICNDMTAYFFGFFFGRTPLISLSPKKTWEGFVGGLFSTMVFGWLLARLLASSSYMTCPMENMSTSMMTLQTGECLTRNSVFVPYDATVPPIVTGLVRWLQLPLSLVTNKALPLVRTVTVVPLQLHGLVFAAFASIIAPFGGFLASGVKRAFKLKDFGDSIPGHGGLTDRFDCQCLMGTFSYIYFQSFIVNTDVTVGQLLQSATTYLTVDQQLELHRKLADYLFNQGISVNQ